jgi:ribulose-5-phosphate 4-epimerase/fuculose-1-phosphate aldolase
MKKTANDEGYVKYHCDYTEEAIEEPPGFEALDAARTKLHDLGLIGVLPSRVADRRSADAAPGRAMEGAPLSGVGFGNVSIRVDDELFLISGTATGAVRDLGFRGYSLVTACDIKANKLSCRGPARASSESMSHWAVYSACAGAGCVIHIHNRRIFDGLLAEKAPATPREAAYGTPEIALAIADLVQRLARDRGSLVMAGHDEGVIAWGPSVEDTLNIVIELFAKFGGSMQPWFAV